MRKLLVLCALLAVAAFAMPAGTALAEFTPVGSLLFQDTYNYTAISGDLNVNITSPSRVSGPLAGQVAYDTANLVGSKDVDGPNQKMDLSDGGAFTHRACVGLTKDFNNNLALGGFTVVADVNPRGGIAEMGVGHNSSAASAIGDTFWDAAGYFAHPGFYANVFDGNLGYGVSTTAFGGNGTSAWPPYFGLGSGYGANFVQLALVCTDATDNNPFNGSGTITIKMYVNGSLITTATGPDFAHNFIAFQADTTNYTSVSNLRIYGNVPEPGTLVLLASAAGLAFVWFRRRR
jgi:hypothetical protein